MLTVKLNLNDIKTKEELIERNIFLEKIEQIIKHVKEKEFTEAAKIMLKENIDLVFLNDFTIRIKTMDFLKLGDEMVRISKK